MLIKKSSCIATLLIASMFFFLLHHFFLVSPSHIMHHLSASIVYPFLQLQKIIVDPIKQWSENRTTVQELRTHIDTLQSERDTIHAENTQLQATLARYKDINDLIQFNKRYAQQGHIAHILLRHISHKEHSLLVTGGLTQGITKDMVAVYKNNVLGRVIEVYPWYSKIQLITDGACQVAACCTK